MVIKRKGNKVYGATTNGKPLSVETYNRLARGINKNPNFRGMKKLPVYKE